MLRDIVEQSQTYINGLIEKKRAEEEEARKKKEIAD
jgi:hypothetical protein